MVSNINYFLWEAASVLVLLMYPTVRFNPLNVDVFVLLPLLLQVLENKEYSLAETYPRHLCLPARMTKDEIRIAASEYFSFVFSFFSH